MGMWQRKSIQMFGVFLPCKTEDTLFETYAEPPSDNWTILINTY